MNHIQVWQLMTLLVCGANLMAQEKPLDSQGRRGITELSDVILREKTPALRLAALKALDVLDFKDDPHAQAALTLAAFEDAQSCRALTPKQMRERRNFPSAWNFETTWKLDASQGRPLLRPQGPPSPALGGTGKGTAAEPYLVATATQLDDIRNKMGPKVHFRQVCDIDLAGYGDKDKGWMPISGTLGSYDGGGFAIRNLRVNRTRMPVGLFGHLQWPQNAPPGRLKRIALEEVRVTGDGPAGALAGQLGAAELGTVIENCTATGNVEGKKMVGGLVGQVRKCQVINSYVAVGVRSAPEAPAVFINQLSWNGTVKDCFYNTEASGVETVPSVAIAVAERHHLDVDLSGNLYRLLRADDPWLRAEASGVAVNITPDTERAMVELIQALGDVRCDVRRLAQADANRLAEEVRDKVTACLAAEYGAPTSTLSRRVLLVRAAGQLASEKSVVFLLQALKDPGAEVRLEAIESLRWLGLNEIARGNPIAAQTRWWQQRAALADRADAALAPLVQGDPSEACRNAARAARVRITGKGGPEAPKPARLEAAFALPPAIPEAERKLVEETYAKAGACRAEALEKFATQVPWPYSSASLVSHAAANLYLNRHLEAANRVIQQNTPVYSEQVGGLSAPLWATVYGLFNSRSLHPSLAGRLTPETEELFKQRMLCYLRLLCQSGKLSAVNDIWKLYGTENHHITFGPVLGYLFLGYLAQDSDYAKIVLHEDKTVGQWCGLWRTYMLDFLKARALGGLWVEMGSCTYAKYSYPGFFALSVGAEDPEVRRRAKLFLDLALVEEAQISYGFMRGGGKSRASTELASGLGVILPLLYGEDALFPGHNGTFDTVVCGYLPPPEAVLLQKRYQYPERPITIINRRPGEMDTNGNFVADSRLINTCFKTRHYLLGSLVRPPDMRLSVLALQHLWGGLIFAGGDGVYPAPVQKTGGRYVDPYYSFQHENVLMAQKNKGAYGTGLMRVYVKPGAKRVERDGWVFVNDGKAYCAIRVAEGKYRWEDAGKYLVPEQDLSPILIEGGDEDAFSSFDGFMAAVTANTLSWSDDRLVYAGPRQPRIEFPARSTGKPPLVNGSAFTFDRSNIYDSPFISSTRGEAKVTVTVGPLKTVYDFSKAP